MTPRTWHTKNSSWPGLFVEGLEQRYMLSASTDVAIAAADSSTVCVAKPWPKDQSVDGASASLVVSGSISSLASGPAMGLETASVSNEAAAAGDTTSGNTSSATLETTDDPGAVSDCVTALVASDADVVTHDMVASDGGDVTTGETTVGLPPEGSNDGGVLVVTDSAVRLAGVDVADSDTAAGDSKDATADGASDASSGDGVVLTNRVLVATVDDSGTSDDSADATTGDGDQSSPDCAAGDQSKDMVDTVDGSKDTNDDDCTDATTASDNEATQRTLVAQDSSNTSSDDTSSDSANTESDGTVVDHFGGINTGSSDSADAGASADTTGAVADDTQVLHPTDSGSGDTTAEPGTVEIDHPIMYTLGGETTTSVELHRKDVKHIAREIKRGHDIDFDVDALMQLHATAKKRTRKLIQRVIATSYAQNHSASVSTTSGILPSIDEAYAALGSPTARLKLHHAH